MTRALGEDETPTIRDHSTMKHPTREELLLLVSGAANEADRTSLRQHLAGCRACTDAYATLRRPLMEPAALIGQTIDGKFKVDGFLEEGGMGALYTGLALQSGREIVLKVLLPHALEDPNQAFRIRSEWQTLALVKHPNVVELLGFGTLPDGREYLVLERLRGETVSQFLKDRPFTIRGALRILQQLLSALDTTHAKGVLHRDLKPSNLMLLHSPNGLVLKVLDFGLAKTVSSAPRTQPHLVMGSAGFLAPEVLVGTPASEQSDLYGVGCIAWRMMTGKPVFEAKTTQEMLHAHLHQRPPSLRSLVPDAPPLVDELLTRLLEPELDRRYASARAALQVVTAVLETPATGENLKPDPSAFRTELVQERQKTRPQFGAKPLSKPSKAAAKPATKALTKPARPAVKK